MTTKKLCLFAVLVFSANLAIAQEAEHNTTDFDFILGSWQVENRMLKERLAGSDEWITYPSTCKMWKHLGGMAVLDECRGTRNGQSYIGSSYRIYNRNTGEWSIFWASTAFPDWA